jgi:hypothetical protein
LVAGYSQARASLVCPILVFIFVFFPVCNWLGDAFLYFIFLPLFVSERKKKIIVNMDAAVIIAIARAFSFYNCPNHEVQQLADFRM